MHLVSALSPHRFDEPGLSRRSKASYLIDGEAIVVDATGLSVFDLLRYRQHDGAAVLCAFDLIELDGEFPEVRWRQLEPIERFPRYSLGI